MRIAAVGVPISQGSKRVIKGRVIEMSDARLKEWRRNLALSASEQGAVIYEGAVSVRLDFFFTRPKGHFGARGLRPSAPRVPSVRPDIDKLARAALDALTGICFRDDAQIAELVCVKHYAGDGVPPGITVEVEEIE